MIDVKHYITPDGRDRFTEWLESLDGDTRRRIQAVIHRMSWGNLPDLKALGGGLLECRLNFGPGYRIYLARVGAGVIVLLHGGAKQRQSKDIRRARRYLREYARGSGI